MSLSRRFADLRIGYKLLLGYSTIFIFICALSSIIIYYFVGNTIESNIESELKNTTTTILNMVRASVDVSIKNHLRAVAEKNREIAEYYYQSYRRGLISEQQAKAQTQNVFLSQTIGKTGYIYCLDSNGIIVIHPQKALLGVDLSANAFIRDQKRRKSGYLEYDWKNPGESKARAKALYMTYFAPWDWIISVSSYRAEFRELVNVADFRDRILSLKFGRTGYSYVIDSKGKLIIHPLLEGENIYQEKDQQGRRFIEELCERKSGKIIYPWKNPGEKSYREKLVMFNYIPELDWIVASSCYLDEFYAPLKTVNRIFMATVAFCLLLVLPMTLMLTASITHPLRDLMSRFSEAADGDTTVRMVPQSRDEVGMLARYFNAFMDRLEIYSESLKAEIADRKKAEEAIRKSEAKYRELVQNANSIIIRVDMRGKITFFNEFAQSFFGYSEEEILGRNSVGTIMPFRDSAGRSMREMMERVAKAPEDYRYYEVENMRRNGERVWVAWTNKAVRDAEGNVVEYLIIGHDITEAKEAEQEMARMRHYLKNIIDSMPSILVGVDLAGRVTQWNREAIKITGVDQKQALGTEVQQVLPQFQENMEMVRRAIREKAPKKMEKVLHPIKGSGNFADIMVYPIILEKMEGAVIRIDDVTARARMEDMMVQTEKMMSVGGLAAGMAHEINNPIGGILQSSQNILRRLSLDFDANQQIAREMGIDLTAVHRYLEARSILKFLQGIREAGERASKTVQNMLNFSRHSESRKTLVQLSDVLDKMVEMAAQDYDLKKRYDFRHIRIQREYAPDMALVPCVAMEIEQVILNLLRNAAQAMGDMKIRTQPPCITLRLHQNNGSAVIEIQDNGPGMDEKVRKRIFEPFFTTKEVGLGTGLGLSVSYFIVTNNHSGSMAVESTPDHGAKFIIELPLAGNELN